LDSWKEIAAYLRKDIRTVQLWEKKEGLPVHRHAHAARATVYAYPAELDAWLAERQQKSATGSNPSLSEVPSSSKWRKVLLSTLLVSLVVGGLLTAAAVYRHRAEKASSPTKPRANTIAVLPFEDLSPQQRQDHLADGLTDDIIVALGQTGQLPVISRRSSSQFKSTHEPLPQIAESLHADFVLEGTFVRAGRRVRITADLVDASSDRHFWTQSYERDLADVLSMQDEVAASIASSVTEKVTGRTAGIQAASRPVNPEARAAYLTGRFFWNKRDEPGLKKAIDYFNQAIAKDPQYAPAYSGLADCYTLLSVWGSLTSRWDWNVNAAEQYFQKAIQANPNYAVAHQWYGEFLGDLGRATQSIAESEKAVQLDPLSPMAGCDLSVTYIHARMPEKAVNALQRVLTFAPDFQPAHLYLIAPYQAMGQIDKAEEEARRYVELTGDNSALRKFRIDRDAAEGRTQQAKQEAEELLRHSREGLFGAYNAASVYFTVGDKEAGYRELEKAYQQHSWLLVNLPVDKSFDSVRKEPRFRDLLRRVGLPGQ
jgi:TolB-like protein/Tfp pilus assembly protein PilF